MLSPLLSQSRLGHWQLRPWHDFADRGRFRLPESATKLRARVETNTVYYMANYAALLAVALAVLVLLWPYVLLGVWNNPPRWSNTSHLLLQWQP